MPHARVNGREIFHIDHGGDGPPVIFSHGLLMDHAMFDPQVAALSPRYRCVTRDERGHGRTATDVLEPFSYYDSADDLVGLLRHLGIKRAVLAGMSQGGFLSLRCALRHPERVRALILLNTQPGPEDPETIPRNAALLDAWTGGGLTDGMADIIETVILGPGWSGSAAWRAKWRTMTAPNLRGVFATLMARDDVTARLGDILVPALVVHGDADTAIPIGRGEEMARLLPDARFVAVPGAAHAANLTHPGPVNAAIQTFLARLTT